MNKYVDFEDIGWFCKAIKISFNCVFCIFLILNSRKFGPFRYPYISSFTSKIDKFTKISNLAPDLSFYVVVSDSLNENFPRRPIINIKLDLYHLHIYITHIWKNTCLLENVYKKKNVFAPIPYPEKMCCFMCYIYVNKSFCETLRYISALI